MRSWRQEVPTRSVRILDLDRSAQHPDLDPLLAMAAGTEEPELAVRGGPLLAPRLRDVGDDLLVPLEDGPWQVVPPTGAAWTGWPSSRSPGPASDRTTSASRSTHAA